jgi:hypothetical protein
MIYRSRDILERVKAQPFVPFRIHTTSRRIHEIRHPELAMVSPSFVFIGIPRPNYQETGVIDNFVQVALMHISEIEPVGESSPPQTGGGTTVPV